MQGEKDSFGREALDTLIKLVEVTRGALIFILEERSLGFPGSLEVPFQSKVALRPLFFSAPALLGLPHGAGGYSRRLHRQHGGAHEAEPGAEAQKRRRFRLAVH